MVQTESNVTRIVDRLVDRGLMTRETCPENRRKVDIRITDDGVRAYREARDVVFDVHRRIGDRLTDGELEMVSDALDILRGGDAASGNPSDQPEKRPVEPEGSAG
jgi:DNA-binding MarR family transcriptional regulator